MLGPISSLPEIRSKLSVEGCIVAVGDNEPRRRLSESARSMGVPLVNAVHPSAFVDPAVKLGEGIVIAPGAVVVGGTRIADGAVVNPGAVLDHDNVLEEWVSVSPGVHTGGRVHICRDAFLGVGAAVLPDLRIGAGATVGAGAVVIRDVAPGDTVVGVPARPISASR